MRSWQFKILGIEHKSRVDKNRNEPTTPDSDQFEINAVPVLEIKAARGDEAASDDKKAVFSFRPPSARRPTVSLAAERGVSSPQTSPSSSGDILAAKRAFLASYREYEATSELDHIRRQYYTRLDLDQHVYLDYTGGNLYPSHLIDRHHRVLKAHVFGNTHSASPAASLSTAYQTAARSAILSFLDASPDEYEVILTPNASGGLGIVSNCYSFSGKRLLLADDSHMSVVGMATSATHQGGQVTWVSLNEEDHTVNSAEFKREIRDTRGVDRPGLAFFTGQSNITGAKVDPEWMDLARRNGWDIGLDASALAPSTRISLRQQPVEFLVISVYKIIGYPTGVGALVVSKRARQTLLRRTTFAGGTVSAVVPHDNRFILRESHAAYEDGTINYLSLPAVAWGLEWIAPLIPKISQRTSILVQYLWSTLRAIRFDDASGTPLLRIQGPPPGPQRGATLSLIFNRPDGGDSRLEHFEFIVWAAARQNISLRGGPCLCNPGASAAVLENVGFEDWLQTKYSPYGIIRVSLGVASNFEDCYRLVRFSRQLARLEHYTAQREAWLATGL